MFYKPHHGIYSNAFYKPYRDMTYEYFISQLTVSPKISQRHTRETEFC